MTGPGLVIARIGEISVTSTEVYTPAGSFPLSGSVWQVTDYWTVERRTPTWAVVAAIVGFCVLTVFSLLFLLVREEHHRGIATVTVAHGSHAYTTRIPVTAQDQMRYIFDQVNYVRALAAV